MPWKQSAHWINKRIRYTTLFCYKTLNPFLLRICSCGTMVVSIAQIPNLDSTERELEHCEARLHEIPQITQHFPHLLWARLLITVWRLNCFRGQIHSIPGYWSILEYSWSNVFQFCSCRGSKNRYCFRPEDSNIYYSFHRNYCIRAPWSESLSLNNEVNNCPFVRTSVSFVPLQIIMRTLFKLIFCTFCYDISFKC